MLMMHAALTVIAVRAFGNPGWKMDGDKIAVDASGNPIYVKDDGSEQAVEAGTVGRLNGEAKTFRERAEAAEAKVRAFGDLDPVKAKEALETVGKIADKKLYESGEVDTLKQQITASMQAQLDEVKKSNGDLTTERDGLIKKTAFQSSEFIRERVAVPRDMFEATFERNLKVENGKVVPYGPDGNPIYSAKRMGEIADVDEALEIMVSRHPNKDAILRAPTGGGTGNQGGGGSQGKGRVVKRSDFNGMSPMDQATIAGQAAKGEISLVD